MEDHLKNVNFEFVKPKQKKLTPEIIDIDTLPDKIFKVINKVVLLFAKTLRDFRLKICYSKKKLNCLGKKVVNLKKN